MRTCGLVRTRKLHTHCIVLLAVIKEVHGYWGEREGWAGPTTALHRVCSVQSLIPNYLRGLHITVVVPCYGQVAVLERDGKGATTGIGPLQVIETEGVTRIGRRCVRVGTESPSSYPLLPSLYWLSPSTVLPLLCSLYCRNHSSLLLILGLFISSVATPLHPNPSGTLTVRLPYCKSFELRWHLLWSL